MGWQDAPLADQQSNAKPAWMSAPVVGVDQPETPKTPTPSVMNMAGDFSEALYNINPLALAGRAVNKGMTGLQELGGAGGAYLGEQAAKLTGVNRENAIRMGAIGQASGEVAANLPFMGFGKVAAIPEAAKTVASKYAPMLETFKQAGTMPSVGQLTDNTFFHGLENLAGKYPGGAGIMENFIKNQQKQMGTQTITGVSAEAGGRAIEKGITGEGGFLGRTKATWNMLDDALASKIPRGAETAPVNTARVLDELTAAPQGLTATSKILTNPKLQEIYNAFKSDLAPPKVALPGQEVPSIYKTIDRNVIEQIQPPILKTIETAATELHPHGYGAPSPPVSLPTTDVGSKITVPYQTLRGLRSKVGSMLDNALVSGIPGGELKQLYGALSKDMEAAANQAGAGREFARQNNYYRARMGRIEDVLDRVIGKGRQPEDIFKTFMPTDPAQAGKVRTVMRSLDASERKVVSEAVVNRMGKASPGKQDEFGELFSSEVFLTNWNKLSPGAKQQIFPDEPLRSNIEKVAKASAAIREGRGIYANPSGTAGSFAAYRIFLSPLTAAGALAGGMPGAAAGILVESAAHMGGAKLGAKLLTSPKFVEWLARPINPARGEAAQHLVRLGAIYSNEKDEGVKEELAKFIQSIQPQEAAP